MDIFERIAKDSGGPLGQYRKKAFGYYMFPKLEGELGPHMKFNGKDVLCLPTILKSGRLMPRLLRNGVLPIQWVAV